MYVLISLFLVLDSQSFNLGKSLKHLSSGRMMMYNELKNCQLPTNTAEVLILHDRCIYLFVKGSRHVLHSSTLLSNGV